MKRYIRLLIIFVIPLFVFFLSIELVLRKIPNDFKYKAKYLDKNSEKLDLLILGSSHSLSFVIPENLPMNAFNAANLNQTLKYDHFIFSKYKDKMKNLKTVIIPISYGSFFTSLDNGKDKWRIKDYKLYMGYDDVNPLKYNLEVTNGSTAVQFQQCYDYLIKGEDMIDCSEKGFGIKFSRDPQSKLEITGKSVSDRHNRECSLDYVEENLMHLEYIIGECQKRSIKVVLYTAPAYKSYRTYLKPELLKKTYELIKVIESKYDNVKYKNYLEDERFDSNLFRDVDHLNEMGAIKFTDILLKEMIIGKEL